MFYVVGIFSVLFFQKHLLWTVLKTIFPLRLLQTHFVCDFLLGISPDVFPGDVCNWRFLVIFLVKMTFCFFLVHFFKPTFCARHFFGPSPCAFSQGLFGAFSCGYFFRALFLRVPSRCWFEGSFCIYNFALAFSVRQFAVAFRAFFGWGFPLTLLSKFLPWVLS